MNTGIWVGAFLAAAALGLVAYSIRVDSRHRSDLEADLDELAGDYHTPADRIAALETQLAAVIAHLTNTQPTTGRHAKTGGPQ